MVNEIDYSTSKGRVIDYVKVNEHPESNHTLQIALRSFAKITAEIAFRRLVPSDDLNERELAETMEILIPHPPTREAIIKSFLSNYYPWVAAAEKAEFILYPENSRLHCLIENAGNSKELSARPIVEATHSFINMEGLDEITPVLSEKIGLRDQPLSTVRVIIGQTVLHARHAGEIIKTGPLHGVLIYDACALIADYTTDRPHFKKLVHKQRYWDEESARRVDSFAAHIRDLRDYSPVSWYWDTVAKSIKPFSNAFGQGKRS